SGFPVFWGSSVKSTRGFALNLIRTGVFGIGTKPRYFGSSVKSLGRGAASCWPAIAGRSLISLARPSIVTAVGAIVTTWLPPAATEVEPAAGSTAAAGGGAALEAAACFFWL